MFHRREKQESLDQRDHEDLRVHVVKVVCQDHRERQALKVHQETMGLKGRKEHRYIFILGELIYTCTSRRGHYVKISLLLS